MAQTITDKMIQTFIKESTQRLIAMYIGINAIKDEIRISKNLPRRMSNYAQVPLYSIGIDPKRIINFPDKEELAAGSRLDRVVKSHADPLPLLLASGSIEYDRSLGLLRKNCDNLLIVLGECLMLPITETEHS